jgi:hypothetical protein
MHPHTRHVCCRLSHSLLWGAVLAVYLCSGSLTSLEFKLLLSVTVPVHPAASLALAPAFSVEAEPHYMMPKRPELAGCFS